MGEKGIESPAVGTGAGAFSGMVAGAGPHVGGLGAGGELVTGTSPADVSAGSGIPGMAADISLAPDPSSPSVVFEPPKG